MNKAPKTPATKTAFKPKRPVNWTEGEKLDIAKTSLELMAGNPDLGRLEAVREAVEQMPASRRKLIKDMAHTSWIIPLWDKLAADADARNEYEAATPAASVTEALVSPAGPEAVTGPENAPQDDKSAIALAPDGTPRMWRGKPMTIAQYEAMRDRGTKARASLQAQREAGTVGPMVRWNEGEWTTVAKAFRRLKRAKPEGKDYFLFLEAMQTALPEKRQREIKTFYQVRENLEPLYAQADREIEIEHEANAAHRAELRAQRERDKAEAREREEREAVEARERLERETAEAMAAQESAANAEAMARQTARFATQFDAAGHEDAMTLDQVIALGARKFARAILPAIMQEIKSEFAKELGAFMRPNVSRAPIHSPVMESPPAAPRKPRVFILGGRPDWHRDIEQAFGAKLDLTFSSGSAEGDTTQGGAARADLCIVCSDAISHRDVDKLRAIRGDFERVDGGTSSIKKRLSLYLTERGKSVH
ncbi:hypothetical protein P0D88_34880 [Paraburkholderia sp. RL18-103-BIB-C]|uniref:hypothetical protein n=1 Tax=Paraburkholderia sp. RL18-103-BIB-C TaxID=3031637 RepID=UPI0038B6E5F4